MAKHTHWYSKRRRKHKSKRISYSEQLRKSLLLREKYENKDIELPEEKYIIKKVHWLIAYISLGAIAPGILFAGIILKGRSTLWFSIPLTLAILFLSRHAYVKTVSIAKAIEETANKDAHGSVWDTGSERIECIGEYANVCYILFFLLWLKLLVPSINVGIVVFVVIFLLLSFSYELIVGIVKFSALIFSAFLCLIKGKCPFDFSK